MKADYAKIASMRIEREKRSTSTYASDIVYSLLDRLDAAEACRVGWAFKIGDSVRKHSGSWWEGRVVGFYSTEQTPRGYCVQLEQPNGPVQIYPEKALELMEGE